RRLVELEVVQLQPGSRFPAEAEYRFHHALVRDAAYNLVPDGLRMTGHLQAGEWLEAAGESEPLVLGEHFKLGGQKQKAIHFFTRACKQSCERQRTDLQGAQRCLEAALSCGPTGQALTELQVLEAYIVFWMADFARTLAVSHEVLPKLPEGSASWIQVVGNLIMMSSKSGRPHEAVALGRDLLRIEPAPEANSTYSEALAFLGAMYQWTGQRSEALTVLERLAQISTRGAAHDSFALGWHCLTQGYFDYDLDARPWRCRTLAEEGMAAFGRVGADRNELVPRTLLGQALAALGEMTRAAKVMSEGLAGARYFDQVFTWLQMHTALVLSGSSEPTHQEEALRLALYARETERQNPMHLGLATLSLGRVALAQGSPSEAESWAREACELLGALIIYQLTARTCLSAALLAQGRAVEARAEAEQAVRALEQMGGGGVASVGVCLALAEACHAQGDDAAAEGALRRALAYVRLRAQDLPDETARERFLSQVPENARVLQLVGPRSL
ncbi:MAG TPA: serine/threonine-protein kinase PknK, partial [Hyalangium sp.]|nr:serine/threonine-protein kinase PknK [Hyalangium sp.]